MRLAGALTMVLGFLVFVGLATVPASVTVMEERVSCNPPALDVLVTEADPTSSPRVRRIEQRIIDACVSQSWERLIVGTAVGAGIGFAGLLLLVRRPAPRYQAPGSSSGIAPPGPPERSGPSVEPELPAQPRHQQPWG
ncbi:hypothetical protein [Nocardioides pacificus]